MVHSSHTNIQEPKLTGMGMLRPHTETLSQEFDERAPHISITISILFYALVLHVLLIIFMVFASSLCLAQNVIMLHARYLLYNDI